MRRATESDIPAIADVFIEARTRCLPFLNWEYDHVIMCEVFGRQMKHYEFWVEELDGRVVAMMAFSPDELEHLYVHPDHQGQRIGKRLFLHLTETLKSDFRFWVFQENANARAFYERLGAELEFETDGRDNMEKFPDCRYWYRYHTE